MNVEAAHNDDTRGIASAQEELTAKFRLDDRIAFVTGAGGGLGREISMVLACAGATVICADIDAEAVEQSAREVTRFGGRAIATTLDVSTSSEVDGALARIVSEHGRLDVICTAAALFDVMPIAETSDATLERLVAVNLLGVYYCCRAGARIMSEQRSGSIVNFASEAVDRVIPDIAVYGMTKAGVAQLTKVLALEMAPFGVRANVIAPGYIRTGMTESRFRRPDGTVDMAAAEDAFAAAASAIPLGRMGLPSDIAYAALYLASEAAGWMTGQILRPNGGMAMPW